MGFFSRWLGPQRRAKARYDRFMQLSIWATAENTALAFEEISSAINLDSQNIWYKLQRVNLYQTRMLHFERSQIGYGINDAIRDCESVLQIDPKCADAYLERGQLYEDSQRRVQAIKDLSMAYSLALYGDVRVAERSEELLRNLGVVAELCGTAALAFDGTDSKELVEAINAYYRFEYDNALDCLASAITSNPNYVRALKYRALVLSTKGQHESAAHDFSRVIELEGSSRDYYDRGSAYLRAGRYHEAITDFDKALDLDSRFGQAYFNRATALLNNGSFKKATDDYTKALQYGGEDPACFYWRGIADKRLGHSADALADFQHAVRLSKQGVTRASAQKEIDQMAAEQRHSH